MKQFKHNGQLRIIWSKTFKGFTNLGKKKFRTYILNNNHVLLERGLIKKIRYVGRLINGEIVNLQKQ